MLEVEIHVRVVINEDHRFSLDMTKSANSKIKNIAEDLAELLGQQKYGLTFFY